MRNECVDGNTAAAAVAYALSELVTLYPITPSSPMGELADAWASSGRTNLWGMVPRVVEMQSEGGAAGALHGALQTGALATTFTSSQGLLLMLPNMFKIAGELPSAVIHVPARAVATHALSIFGDHSDVMAARTTGFAMLASSSVQEAQDLAVVAHLASLQTRVPFLHFFDGVRTVRLYRPFPAAELVAALPLSVSRVAVLDRTKEPGAYGEPLFLDVVATLAEASTNGLRGPAAMPRVTGGRYGLSSKEFTPAMVKGVFDELGSEVPRPRITVGIVDDVTNLSVRPDRDFELPIPEGDVRAVFYGLGSDGTVGANKNTVKIVDEHSDLHAQGYFVYDSKKAGAMTVSHLRFSRQPIRSTYLIDQADLVACHHFGFLFTQDVLAVAKPGATVLLNAPYPPEEVWDVLPEKVQRAIIDKKLKVHVIDAHRLSLIHI